MRFFQRNILFLLLLLGSSYYLYAQTQVQCGTIENIENFPSNIIESRDVTVWLPEDYSNKKKYAVLYMHDGQMLFDASNTWNHQEWKVDENMCKLLAENKIQPSIVVGIHHISENRHSDYFPQKPFESLTEEQKLSIMEAVRNQDMPLFNIPIQSDKYLKFIVQELKPYIDAHYSTYKNRKHTFIGGSSMGGLISWYALSEYPKVFGGAFCMSTHWPGIFEMENNPIPQSFYEYLDKNLPSLRNHKIYFDYGDQTLDALYPPHQEKIDELMRTKKHSEKNWKTEFFPGHAHNEESWAERLSIPLEFLLN